MHAMNVEKGEGEGVSFFRIERIRAVFAIFDLSAVPFYHPSLRIVETGSKQSMLKTSLRKLKVLLEQQMGAFQLYACNLATLLEAGEEPVCDVFGRLNKGMFYLYWSFKFL
jgi:hypothetical protein